MRPQTNDDCRTGSVVSVPKRLGTREQPRGAKDSGGRMIATSRFSACASVSLPVGSFACLPLCFPGLSDTLPPEAPASHPTIRPEARRRSRPPETFLPRPASNPQPQGPGLCCAVRGGQYALAAVAGPDLRAAMSFTSKVLRAEAASVCSVETDGTFRPPSASSAKPCPTRVSQSTDGPLATKDTS
jgi:hypothetical protein